MRYYVWVNRGTETRPVPLLSEGYQGPYALDTAKQYARIAASHGRYGRIVSSNTDPHRLQVVRAYPAGGKAKPNHPQHAEDLARYLSQDFYEGDYIDLAYDLFGDDVDIYALEPEEVEQLKAKVEAEERRRGRDCETPAYRFFSDVRIPPPGQWYIHFTSASFSHFAYGVSVEDSLALTRVCGPKEKRRAGPDNTDIDNPFFEVLWGFAFPVTLPDRELRSGASKYGASRRETPFLLFRSDEVVVAYHGDDDETQAMFVIGSEYDLIQGFYNADSWDSGWTIQTEEGESGFQKVGEMVAWAAEHYPRRQEMVANRRLVLPRVVGRDVALPPATRNPRQPTLQERIAHEIKGELPGWMHYQARYVLGRWPGAQLLGYGSNGSVWDVGDRVVKYTISDEEIAVIEGSPEWLLPRIWDIYPVPASEDERSDNLGGYIIEREAAEPVLQAFQNRPRRDQAALRRLMEALHAAEDAPSTKAMRKAALAAQKVPGGMGFADALSELASQDLFVHDLLEDNLGVTSDGRLVAFDPGWFEHL